MRFSLKGRRRGLRVGASGLCVRLHPRRPGAQQAGLRGHHRRLLVGFPGLNRGSPVCSVLTGHRRGGNGSPAKENGAGVVVSAVQFLSHSPAPTESPGHRCQITTGSCLPERALSREERHYEVSVDTSAHGGAGRAGPSVTPVPRSVKARQPRAVRQAEVSPGARLRPQV